MEFKELIEVRRSVRKYAAAELTKAEVEAIVTEALEAPSWKNREPTRYHVILDAALKECLRTQAMPEGNAAKCVNAAALVAVTFKKGLSGFTLQSDGTNTPDNELGDMWGAYDAGLASAYFMLAARNRGWDSLVIGIRDAAKAVEVLGLPADETLTAIIVLGKGDQSMPKPPRKPAADVAMVR